MKNDLKIILREILSQMESSGMKRPAPAALREILRERGISENLISDALFLLDVIGDIASGQKPVSRPTRVLSSEESRGINPALVGKLFRLYYLGYMNRDDMEVVMTNLLFVPPDIQEDRARQSVGSILGITPAQVDYIFDGGMDSAVVH